jgi:hypothetical protein
MIRSALAAAVSARSSQIFPSRGTHESFPKEAVKSFRSQVLAATRQVTR